MTMGESVRYLVPALVSILVAVLSTVFWFINPVTAIFGWLGGEAVRLTGRRPPFDSDYTAVFALSFVWPLLVCPVFWLNERLSGGRGWSFVLLLASTFFAAGFGIQFWRSSR